MLQITTPLNLKSSNPTWGPIDLHSGKLVLAQMELKLHFPAGFWCQWLVFLSLPGMSHDSRLHHGGSRGAGKGSNCWQGKGREGEVVGGLVWSVWRCGYPAGLRKAILRNRGGWDACSWRAPGKAHRHTPGVREATLPLVLPPGLVLSWNFGFKADWATPGTDCPWEA